MVEKFLWIFLGEKDRLGDRLAERSWLWCVVGGGLHREIDAEDDMLRWWSWMRKKKEERIF